MAYGVYKACKGDSSDTKYVAVLESEADAKQAVARMQELQKQKKDIYFAYVDGWEFRCYWTYEEIKPVSLEGFNKMVDDELQEMADEFGDEEADDE